MNLHLLSHEVECITIRARMDNNHHTIASSYNINNSISPVWFQYKLFKNISFQYFCCQETDVNLRYFECYMFHLDKSCYFIFIFRDKIVTAIMSRFSKCISEAHSWC